jgi:hypothetical protein
VAVLLAERHPAIALFESHGFDQRRWRLFSRKI